MWIRIAGSPQYRTWTSDTEEVNVRVTINGVVYNRAWIISKTKGASSLSVSKPKPSSFFAEDTSSPVTIEFIIDSDGDYKENIDGAGDTFVFTWLLNGINTDYSAFATVVSGTFSTGTFNAWLGLETSPSWTVEDTGSGGHTIGTVQIQIRRDSNGIIITEFNAILDAFSDPT
jgi:hypothetical protein